LLAIPDCLTYKVVLSLAEGMARKPWALACGFLPSQRQLDGFEERNVKIYDPLVRAFLGTLIVVAALVGLPIVVGLLAGATGQGLVATWFGGFVALLGALALFMLVVGVIAIGILVGDELFG
jgi:hypothetical protein